MPDVFVNYRTGDEESAATMIARELARRFGGERIFFASNSIEAGRRFPVELIKAVEESERSSSYRRRWAEVRGADGRPALESEQDWTRREIQIALDRGILVIPVLVERLRASTAPASRTICWSWRTTSTGDSTTETPSRTWRRSAIPSPACCPSWAQRTTTPARRRSGRKRSPAKKRPMPGTPGCGRATSNSACVAASETSTETCPAPSSTSRRGR